MFNNDVEFQSHALERLFGRLAGLVTYAEVQQTLKTKPMRNGNNRVEIKRLGATYRVADSSAHNGEIKGDKIFALVTYCNGGARVDTVALSF